MTEQTNQNGSSQAASGQSSSSSQSQSGSQTQAGSGQGAASGQNQQSQQTQNSGPQRPAWAVDGQWDTAANSLIPDKIGEELNGLRAFKAEQDVRKNSLPKELDFQVRNSAEFKLPEGVKFEFDLNDPQLAQFRKIAAARGMDQETFSGILDLYVSNQISEQGRQAAAREENLKQLGATGSQRIDAVATWLNARAGDDGKHVANFIKQWPSAPIVRAMESLIRQFSNQGGADFSQSHRETNTQEAGKIPNFENLSFTQRRTAQMAERMKNDPNYARGVGR